MPQSCCLGTKVPRCLHDVLRDVGVDVPGKNSTHNHMINLSLGTDEALKVKDDPDERPPSCKVTVLKHINKGLTVDPHPIKTTTFY